MEALSQNFSQLLNELLELGFNKKYIEKSLQLTNDKEKAVELILKFQEEEEEYNMKIALINSKKETDPSQLNPSQSNNNNVQNIPINENYKESEDDWYFPKNDYKMVILVRSDLKMGVGKIAAQVGHGGFIIFF